MNELTQSKVEPSLLLLFLLLFLFLFTRESPWNTKTVVLLKVIILMNVPSDKQFRVCLFQLVKEAVASVDGDLVQIEIDELRALLEQGLNTGFTNLLALAQLYMLKVWH